MPVFNDGITATARPDGTGIVTTDVLIVGSGPAGSAALFLSTLGIPNIMITKYRWTANTPRAHITNQRAMEVFRDAGIEDQVLAEATAARTDGRHGLLCTSIAGEEIGRVPLGHAPDGGRLSARVAVHAVDIPQTYLEPILVKNAADARHAGPVLHRIPVPQAGRRRRQRAGARPAHRPRIHDPRQVPHRRRRRAVEGGCRHRTPHGGAMDIGGSMNITFKADLPTSGTAVGALLGLQPGLKRRRSRRRPGPDGPAVERVADRLGLRHQRRAAGPGRGRSNRIIRNLVGVADLEVEIPGTSLWGNNEMWATHLQKGRVFCAGDAIHRTRRANGLGSNTSIQDSYNLAWKLAAVIKGQAGPELLETYSTERAPVAKQIVNRANQSSHYKPIDALGVADATTDEEFTEKLQLRGRRTRLGVSSRRTALRKT